MASNVKLRKPRNVLGGTSSGNKQIGRPKSWTEFNTRFQAVTGPINIDITPVPKSDGGVKMREPVAYRKVRPVSASILDESDAIPVDAGSNPDLTNPRPSSPRYKSFMAPNPWRMTSNKSKISNSRSKSHSGTEELHHLKPEEQSANYDETTSNYPATNNAKNAAEDKKLENNAPQAKKSDKISKPFEPKAPHSGSFSDSDSLDSAVVVSEGSFTDSNRAPSSEKSPRWGRENRESYDLDSSSTISEKAAETERQLDIIRQQENPDKTEIILSKRLTILDKGNATRDRSAGNFTTFTLPVPKIYISADKRENAEDKNATMDHYDEPSYDDFNDGHFYRHEQRLDLLPDNHLAGENRSIVPSPLKSCYAPIATYDIPVDEYLEDDSEDESVSEVSRSNISSCYGYDGDKSAEEYMSPRPTARPRQTSIKSLPKMSPEVENTSQRRLNSDETDGKSANHEKTDSKSGTWPRRRVKKKEERIVDTEELMRRFRKTRETHLARFKNIYADSRKRVDDVMQGLKQSMTEYGYREWYPRVR